jgi:hypothetical protein
MPCCGLHEYQQRAPLKYTLSGGAVFWGAFSAALFAGALLSWSAKGRSLLRVQANFLRALWRETMRQRDSIPARYSCRLSGRLWLLSPRLAALVYRRPEIAFIYWPCLGLAILVWAGLALFAS